jgi:predicted nucleic acid-binding protein
VSTRFIVDTSVAVAAAMGENSSQGFLEPMGKAFRSGYLVPAHWRLEVANAVIENLQRNRKPNSEAEKYIQDIGQAGFCERFSDIPRGRVTSLLGFLQRSAGRVDVSADDK